MESCALCNQSQCCPEHCCDWDSCKCGDCSACGGVDRPVAVQRVVEVELSEATNNMSGSNNIAPRPPTEENIRALEQVSELSSRISTLDIQSTAPTDSGAYRDTFTFTDISEIERRATERIRLRREEEAKLEREREEVRQKEKDRHEAILASSRDIIAKNKDVLQKTQETLNRLKATIEGCKETEKNYQKFQDTFNEVISKTLSRFSESVENVEELKNKYGVPRICSIGEAAVLIAERRKVVFLIGAGVSVASGIPVYKDSEDRWELDGELLTHEEMARMEVLQSYPMEFWQKQQHFRMIIAQNQPNACHFAVSEFYHMYRSQGRAAAVITQNIDGYDRMVLGHDAELYEVHGNLEYMRCLSESCELSKELLPAPPAEYLEYIPMCPDPSCGAITRPNILLFDESYNEEIYKADSAMKAVEEADCLIVLGTQLKCGLPRRLVRKAVENRALVVEVNICPCVEYGNVLVIPDGCESVMPELLGIVRDHIIS